MILGEESLNKNGLPTIEQLLQLPFFKASSSSSSLSIDNNNSYMPTSSLEAAASLSSSTGASAKAFSASRAKDLLRKCRDMLERRLQDEQRELWKLHKR